MALTFPCLCLLEAKRIKAKFVMIDSGNDIKLSTI